MMPVENAMASPGRDRVDRQLAAAEQACARSNTQLTELRRTVLGLVLQAERPLTAYQLLDRLKETRGRAMPPTVYRALDFLLDNKFIHKVESLNAFVACENGHHEHAIQFLICRGCGQVTEIEDHSVSEALETASRKVGFHPTSTIVEIEGRCAACAAPS
jgi:Fur family zinc uptake transcriptional regulator